MEEREAVVGRLLSEQAKTLATAESCSGGFIAHRMTNVPGSSGYFAGGVVSYSNSAKESLLGVTSEALETHGAVSEVVARQMAEGVRRRFGTDYGVACTVIAGPSGGTEEKPVGLVYIGVAGPNGTTIKKCNFEGDRINVKSQTADRALDLVLEALG